MSALRPLDLNDHTITEKIYFIRGQKVMLDRDLAEMYDVPTKALKQAVKRNIERFPEDFMFEMSKKEFENWRSQIVTSNSDNMGLRYMPFCFTEHGVLMLSSVLKSKRAVQVNIQIMRVYAKMRELLVTHKDILLKLEVLEKKVYKNEEDISIVFNHLKQLIAQPKTRKERIGFKKEW